MTDNKVVELEKRIDRIELLLNNIEIVRHGHWIDATNKGVWCSVCNTYTIYRSHYCPSCGAKMDEDEPKFSGYPCEKDEDGTTWYAW
jgi:hypothetical protein